MARYKRFRFWAVFGLSFVIYHFVEKGITDPDVGWWAAIPVAMFGVSWLGLVLDCVLDSLENRLGQKR